MSEKTEQPSARRLREARRKGQIPRSRLLSSSVVLLGGGLGLSAVLPRVVTKFEAWTTRLLLTQDASGALREATVWLAWGAGPPLLAAWLAALGVSVAMSGLEFNADHVMPRLERIHPVEGWKKLFSMKPLVEWVKALLVAAVLGWLVWREIARVGPDVLRAVRGTGMEGMLHGLARGESLVSRLAGVLVVLGVGDYLLERRRHLKDLRMTREEVKREHKESEGDPHHKGQRRATHRQLAAGGGARGVKAATVVVVNPTHIAVALRYDAGECAAPYLVGKARDAEALQLRQDAERLGVPVVRDVPLARGLVHYDVGEEIPEELYQAAAAVLRVAREGMAMDVRTGRKAS